MMVTYHCNKDILIMPRINAIYESTSRCDKHLATSPAIKLRPIISNFKLVTLWLICEVLVCVTVRLTAEQKILKVSPKRSGSRLKEEKDTLFNIFFGKRKTDIQKSPCLVCEIYFRFHPLTARSQRDIAFAFTAGRCTSCNGFQAMKDEYVYFCVYH